MIGADASLTGNEETSEPVDTKSPDGSMPIVRGDGGVGPSNSSDDVGEASGVSQASDSTATASPATHDDDRTSWTTTTDTDGVVPGADASTHADEDSAHDGATTVPASSASGEPTSESHECLEPTVIAEGHASSFEQLQLGNPIGDDVAVAEVDDFFAQFEIGAEPTQTFFGRGFGFAVAQDVTSVDVRLVVKAQSECEVETLVGARLARSFGPYWSRTLRRDTWGVAAQTIEFRYTPVPPYQTGPISATSANETAFAMEFAFRSPSGEPCEVNVDGFSIRLVLTDTSTTEWSTPSAVAGDVMDTGWNDTQRLSLEDGSSASISTQPNVGATAVLRAMGYDLSVADSAVITGIELMPVGHQGLGRDFFPRLAQLVSGGERVGDNLADRSPWPQVDFPALGGASELWGAALEPAALNDPSFGVDLSFFSELEAGNGAINLDALPIRVWGCE